MLFIFLPALEILFKPNIYFLHITVVESTMSKFIIYIEHGRFRDYLCQKIDKNSQKTQMFPQHTDVSFMELPLVFSAHII